MMDEEDYTINTNCVVGAVINKRLAKEGHQWQTSPTSNCASNKVIRAQVALCEEFESRYEKQFMDMGFNDRVISYEYYTTVLDQLISDGLHWGHVTGILTFAGAMALHCMKTGHPERVDLVREWTSQFIHKHVEGWMNENNGWVQTHTKVCSAHFVRGDFRRTLTGIKILTKEACPSAFSWTENTPVRKPPTSRLNPPKRKRLNFEDHTDMDVDEPVQTPQPAFHDYLGPEEQLSVEEKLKKAEEHIDGLEQLLGRLKVSRFGLHRFSNDSKMIVFYTGFSSYTLLMNLVQLLRPSAEKMTRWSQVQRKNMRHSAEINTELSFRAESLSLEDQFFLFLVQVRLGLFQSDMGARFNVSQSTVGRIIITWANFLYFQLGSLPIWPSREKIDQHMPDCFRVAYPSTRVILDCTEIRIQTPSALSLNSEFYSHYKGTTTFKCLLGISPAGCITFISSLFAGSISDQNITRQCGLMALIEKGDSVMADKGFLIEEMLKERGASLNIPPFLTKRDQFTKEEVEETQEIARLRIHVERAIRRVKEYHIFDSILPVSIAGSTLQLWTVCFLLTLFRGPLF